MSKTPTTAKATHKSVIYTYWMTRDRDPGNGELSSTVRIWLAQPTFCRIGRGMVWMAPGYLADLYGEWSLDVCLYHARTYPDDERQCICVGGDRVKQPTEDVDRVS